MIKADEFSRRGNTRCMGAHRSPSSPLFVRKLWGNPMYCRSPPVLLSTERSSNCRSGSGKCYARSRMPPAFGLNDMTFNVLSADFTYTCVIRSPTPV